MAEGWDEGWADPPPGLLSWNRLPSTPEHSRAQISVNPTADELLISRALALGERKKGNLPAILPSLSCYQFGCSACRQVWPRLDEYHKWQNIVPLSEVREPYPLLPTHPTPLPNGNVISPTGQINGIRGICMASVQRQLNHQPDELNISNLMTTSSSDNSDSNY